MTVTLPKLKHKVEWSFSPSGNEITLSYRGRDFYSISNVPEDMTIIFRLMNEYEKCANDPTLPITENLDREAIKILRETNRILDY